MLTLMFIDIGGEICNSSFTVDFNTSLQSDR